MTVERHRIGLDRRESGIYLADVQPSGERPEILALRRVGETELTEHPNIDTATIALTFPDRLTQVKTVMVGVDSPFSPDDQVAFELTQSLLEPADKFSFDSINSGFGRRHLGFITRQEQLTKITGSFRLPERETATPPVTARCRALALGLGYLHYCTRDGGELVALVDLAGTAASITLILGDGVVAVSWLPLERFNLDEKVGREKLAVELKTLINYNLSTLMTDGISQPLTALLLFGDHADDSTRTALDSFFTGLVRTPRLRTDLFRNETTIDRSDGHKFVAALGLTVE